MMADPVRVERLRRELMDAHESVDMKADRTVRALILNDPNWHFLAADALTAVRAFNKTLEEMAYAIAEDLPKAEKKRRWWNRKKEVP